MNLTLFFSSLTLEIHWWERMRCSVLASGCCQIVQPLSSWPWIWGLKLLLYWSDVVMEWMLSVFRSPCYRCVPGSTVHWSVTVFFFLICSDYCSHTIGKLLILKEHVISRWLYILSLFCWRIFMLECLFSVLRHIGFSLLVVMCMPIQVRYSQRKKRNTSLHFDFELIWYKSNPTSIREYIWI